MKTVHRSLSADTLVRMGSPELPPDLTASGRQAYEYDPLNQERDSFRLVRVLPKTGTNGCEVRCELSNTRISNEPEFKGNLTS